MAAYDTVKTALDALVAREDTIIQMLKDLQADGQGATTAQLDELLAVITAQADDQATVLPA